MPYDSGLDKKLFSESIEGETSRLTVSVYSYNEGMKKLQISRENRDPQGDYRFSKMGRLTKEEATGVLPLMQEALKKMDE